MILKAKNEWNIKTFGINEVYWEMDKALQDINFRNAINKSLNEKVWYPIVWLQKRI